MGRGIMPNVDCIAFVTQTAADVRMARVNNFAGLHIPAHRRSNRMRRRPGDSADDTANTLVANILWDERSSATPNSFFNFTSDGMPGPVHAYTDSRTDVSRRDGYVYPTGGMTSGSTAWSMTEDIAHAVPYSYFGYLLEGERYFLEATLDLGMNAIQSLIGGPQQGMGVNVFFNQFENRPFYPGATSAQWAGTAMKYEFAGISRAVGWAANLLACMVIVPDNDVQANYVKQVLAVNAKHLHTSTSVIPTSGSGAWSPVGGPISPWMDSFIAMGAYTAYARTGDSNWLSTAEYMARGPIQWAASGYTGLALAYRAMARPSQRIEWNATTNNWFSDGAWFIMADGASISVTTDRITVTVSSYFSYTAGDEVVPSDSDTSFNQVVVPSELGPFGARFYIVNPIGGTSFQLSRTLGGAPIDFTSSYSGLSFGFRLQSANNPATFTNEAGDSYLPISRAVVVLARRNGHPLATQTVINRYDAFQARINSNTWATWHLSTAV